MLSIWPGDKSQLFLERAWQLELSISSALGQHPDGQAVFIGQLVMTCSSQSAPCVLALALSNNKINVIGSGAGDVGATGREEAHARSGIYL